MSGVEGILQVLLRAAVWREKSAAPRICKAGWKVTAGEYEAGRNAGHAGRLWISSSWRLLRVFRECSASTILSVLEMSRRTMGAALAIFAAGITPTNVHRHPEICPLKQLTRSVMPTRSRRRLRAAGPMRSLMMSLVGRIRRIRLRHQRIDVLFALIRGSIRRLPAHWRRVLLQGLLCCVPSLASSRRGRCALPGSHRGWRGGTARW